jgi:hypothetical protein
MVNLKVGMRPRRQAVLTRDSIVALAVPVAQLACAGRADSIRGSLGDAGVMRCDGGID